MLTEFYEDMVSFTNYAQMSASSAVVQVGETVVVLGATTAGDGGHGLFRLDSAPSGATTDGIEVIRTSGGVWRRLWDGRTVSAAWFGAKGDSTSSSTGIDNSAILQAAIAKYDDIKIVFPPSGSKAYRFTAPVPIPNSKQIELSGEGATLAFYSTRADESLFEITNTGSVTDGYRKKYFIGLNITLSGTRAHAIRLLCNESTGEFSCHKFRVRGCSFIGGIYPIWMQTAYSISPEISDCWFGSSGAIRWSACGIGATPMHATSNAVLENVRCQGSVGGSDDGLVHLDGMKSCRVSSLILEGTHSATLQSGLSYALRIKNPGPYYTSIENLWIEFWGNKQPGTHSVKITSELDGADYGLLVRLSAMAGVDDLYAKNSTLVKGGTLIVSGSNVSSKELSGWVIDDLTTSVIVDGVKVIGGSIPSRRFNLRGEVVSGGSGYNNLAFSTSLRTLASYSGGTISQLGNPVSHAGNLVGVRYVQWVPGVGACVAVRKNSNGLSLSINSTPQAGWFSRFGAGDKAGFRCKYLLPHSNSGSTGKSFVAYVGNSTDAAAQSPVTTDWMDVVGCSVGATRGPILGVGPYSTWLNGDLPEWLIVAEWAVGLNCIPDAQSSGDTFDCYEDPASPGIPTGTVIKGSVCRKLGDATIDRYVCTVSGTSRILSLTANTTAGSAVLASVSQILDLIPGDHITVGGVACYVVSVDTASSSATMSASASTNGTGVSVVNTPPEWITIKNYT